MSDGPPGEEREGTPGSELARRHREALEWSALLRGGVTLGPLHPSAALRMWRSLLGQGGGRRLGAYAITAEGRSVYLLPPHFDVGPRGLHLQCRTVTLDGADERGQRVRLERQPAGQVNLYLFLAGRPPF